MKRLRQLWATLTAWSAERRGAVIRDHFCYRNIVERTPTVDGEIVQLECGHRFHLIHNRRVSIPCDICLEKDRAGVTA